MTVPGKSLLSVADDMSVRNRFGTVVEAVGGPEEVETEIALAPSSFDIIDLSMYP